MKEMFMQISLLSILTLASPAQAALKPSSSFKCEASEGRVSEFNFDLYVTGHPMSGYGAFSGMFEAKASELDCNHLIGSIEIERPKGEKWIYMGQSNCISKVDFVLEIDFGAKSDGGKYSAALKFRKYNPFGPEEFESQKMSCWLEK